MTTAEMIIAFAGTSVGGALIGGWINREKNNVEVTLKDQVFYKTLITDIEDRRDKEKKEYEEKIVALTAEVHELKQMIEDVGELKLQHSREILAWENNDAKWRLIVKDKDVIISELIEDKDK